MGINSHLIIMVGIELPEDQRLDEDFYDSCKYDEKTQSYKHEDLDIVFDGMGGSYTRIGKVLHCSEDGRWDPITTDEKYYIAHLDIVRQNVRILLKQTKFASNTSPQLMVFMHYS